MTFQDHAMNTAYQCGAYQALASMMAEAVRDMDSDSEFVAEYAVTRLKMLAEQFEETKEKFEKAVDTA